MRNAIVEVLVIGAVLWIAAGFIVYQKATVEDGVCDDELILVPVVLNPDCQPDIMLRKCSVASDSFDVNCSNAL